MAKTEPNTSIDAVIMAYIAIDWPRRPLRNLYSNETFLFIATSKFGSTELLFSLGFAAFQAWFREGIAHGNAPV